MVASLDFDLGGAGFVDHSGTVDEGGKLGQRADISLYYKLMLLSLPVIVLSLELRVLKTSSKSACLVR